MEIKDLCALIEKNDDEKRGVHFPLTDIYNEGWLLRLALNKGLVQKVLPEKSDNWFSEAQLKSPFLHGKLRETRTHADAVIGSYRFEDKTTTGVEIDKGNFSFFYAIEAKIYAPLSKGISSCKDYNQATRYIGCLAKMAFDARLCDNDFKNLGLYVITPVSESKKANGNIEKIKEELSTRIKNYGEENDMAEFQEWKNWWNKHEKEFFNSIKVSQLNWEQIIDDELTPFYQKCLDYNHKP